MTIKQMRDLSYRKPDNISWEDFEKMEITMTGACGMEFISEFSDKGGVTTIRSEDGEEKQVFNFITEEIHEQLLSPDDLDELEGMDFDDEDCEEPIDDEAIMALNALPELRMFNQEYFLFDKN